MSVLEVLVSAAILLVLGAAAFQSLMPVLRHQEWYHTKHDRVRGLIVLRHQLNSFLQNARILQLTPDLLECHLPERVNTNFGPLTRLDAGENLAYDESRRHTVRMDGQGRVLFDTRVLYRAGEGATMRLSPAGDDKMLVRFAFTGKEKPASEVWKREFVLFLPYDVEFE